MDYRKLSFELLKLLTELRRAKSQKYIDDNLQGEACVLQYISVHSGNVLPGDLSNEMNVSTARVAVTLNNLEKRGMIIRQIDKSDRRKILISATDKGKALAESRQNKVVDVISRTLSLLGEQDAAEYVRITRKWLELVNSNKEMLEVPSSTDFDSG